MKTTIEKRFDQLEPGDVLAFATHKQVVQLVELNGPGACRTVRCVMLGQVPVQLREWTEGSGTIFRVEIEQQPGVLTPAQVHADELLSYVREVKSASVGERSRSARELLDKIDPPKPPTLDEALSMLDEIMRRPSTITPQGVIQERCDRANKLLDRARRSGVLS